MNASLSWIKSYVPELDASYQEFRDAMTLSGTKVEGYTVLDEDLDKIVIGQIKKVEKHPDADKLVVCQVDIGSEQIQIVTGAPNVVEGAKVPTVLHGGRVAGGHDGSKTPGGIQIKKGKLRGVESVGMMCSIEELGSSREMYPDAPENGLYILPDDAPVGADALEYLGLHDANYEFEITSNRVDCYSVLGIAREAAATFGKPFVHEEPVVKKTEGDIRDYLEVEVKDTELCPRYTAMVVKNIRLAPSPRWLRQRLASNGIRPINNVVDITNYVMEEYGQPMHAFDYDTIAGHKIVVKRAQDGEKFVTLDGQERTLDKDILMICDAEKPIGLAGIMGGEDSKITDDVKTLVFESACFDGTNNRLSAKRLGLRTDASGKYEKGLDPNNTVPAILRACQLIEELDAGDVVGGMIDLYPNPVQEKKIAFEPERINAYLGTDISAEQQLSYFPILGITYDDASKMLTIPTFRQDLLRGADIAEEVARFYGYDKIPSTLPSSGSVHGGLTSSFAVDEMIRDAVQACGFSEAMTYSFESPKVFDKLLIDPEDPKRKTVVISNPLGEDYSIMRTSLLNGMFTSLSTNYNRRNKEAALYELSNIYIPKAIPVTELPDERTTLCMGFYGDGDFFTLKGALEVLFDKLGLKGEVRYENRGDLPFLHTGRQAVISYEGEVCGFLGEVHPLVVKNYALAARTYVAHIDIEMLYDKVCTDRKYVGIPKYPAVTRDLSLVMSKNIPAGDVERAIAGCAGDLLEHLELFDLYEGEQVGNGKKSLAYTLRFRAADRTLEEGDIAPLMEKIVKTLEEMGAVLRS